MKARRSLGLLAATMVCLIGLGWTGQAYASTTLFEWALPIQNLNGYPGYSYPDRSNLAPTITYNPQPSIYQIPGDSFTIGTSGQTYHIDTVSLWMLYGALSGPKDTSYLNPVNFPSLTLLVGPDGGTMTSASTTFTKARAYYTGGENYQRSVDGLWRGIYRLDFAVSFDVNGGQKYDYFVNGLMNIGGGTYYTPSLLASNASRSGVSSAGVTDNTFLWYNTGSGVITSATTFPEANYNNSVDVNIQISGSQVVPLPSTLLFLGSGLLGLVGWRMRKR